MTVRKRMLVSAIVALGIAAPVLAQAVKYEPVDLFSLGAYHHTSPTPAQAKTNAFKSSIPAKIKALDGKKVVVEGFMIPYDLTADKVTEFMMVASYDACGFGDLPTRINDWIDVSVPPGKTVYNANGAPIVVRGTLGVGEVFDRDGYLISVYRMVVDRVD